MFHFLFSVKNWFCRKDFESTFLKSLFTQTLRKILAWKKLLFLLIHKLSGRKLGEIPTLTRNCEFDFKLKSKSQIFPANKVLEVGTVWNSPLHILCAAMGPRKTNVGRGPSGNIH
ncbi:hypothetical protein LEP1GSC103_2270 [Leptospira borgpetersenii serovar Javanica str. UI 09931]|uniref:Uncharacterized protein n=3 Tax=Leptospira borgpetersenii TaxID=174 RepID=A0A0E3B5Y9_LEPBO|nr:hypothetical protein LBBP_03775 [Leptospira borgpetersenii serovar Ballum]AXX16872.1 hypothetical protein C4Q31_16365 [Leptospira borgpetersenii serovar Ceylonica]EKQ93913.1 hypothetical protein LEP1GSC101_1774 [Leptospira borgpetersenii str. UI 09149]EKR00060.1 hypothetical protein LEP1GSC121_3562 [Leptospira borgpetersenii serovar Castellonis str. 200801910]EMN57294.1 hypothetical protein LEP1GSC090_2367 [Leptospira borgpetersenii serovar Javanica str. MK146]EMO07998.1 hypothetical protei